MTVIAITGQPGSGKDSVANYLAEHYGFVVTRFSAPLKRLCCQLFGWDYDRVNDLDYKEEKSGHAPVVFDTQALTKIADEQFGVIRQVDVRHLRARLNAIAPGWTRRRILQWVGTETFRELDPSHWQRQGIWEIERALSEESAHVVVADTRFLNEFEGLREAFDTRVVRTVCPGQARTDQGGHAAETEGADVTADFTISAPLGDLDFLYAQVKGVVEGLGVKRVLYGIIPEDGPDANVLIDDSTSTGSGAAEYCGDGGTHEPVVDPDAGCQFDGGAEAD